MALLMDDFFDMPERQMEDDRESALPICEGCELPYRPSDSDAIQYQRYCSKFCEVEQSTESDED